MKNHSSQNPQKNYKQKTHTKDESTSWGPVASWYDKHLQSDNDTYHSKVVFPHMLRLLGKLQGKKVLDLACGQGIFSQMLRDGGAFVTGVDIGKELIEIAKKHNTSIKDTGTHKVEYFVASSDDLYMLKDSSFDIVVCVLAMQNIERIHETIQEVKRVLKPQGRFMFVINHPSFRNPKRTHWSFNEHEGVQYRRVDEYMSDSRIKIDMTPGSKKDKKFTISFHRPLQVYVKALSKQGFMVSGLEEWISHKVSEKGLRQNAENKARKEIPLFMCIDSILGQK